MASEHTYVLVTGANSGLGLNICLRLIDDFVATKSSSTQLTIIFTTRSAKKAADTLQTLQTHLAKTNIQPDRVHFLAENVDLTNLLSIRALAVRLLQSDIPKLDAIILNAGIIGLTGLNWPLAIWTVATDPVHTLCWPQFKVPAVGLVAKQQLPKSPISEPILGEVFCANVFGHYLLAHWLMPLLRACPPSSPGKVIWISSIEAIARHYNRDDLQAVRSSSAYEHSKRLTDLVALTAPKQPATAKSVEKFVTPTFNPSDSPTRASSSTPTIHVVHPGICVTAIVPLHWIMFQLFVLTAYFTRLLGSPWCVVSPYPGAMSATWLALASQDEAAAKQGPGGAVKLGSATHRDGRTHVEKTDVEGWGIDGSGAPFRDTWWARDVFGTWGRIRGATDATSEQVETFVEDGARAWRELEELRDRWERLIAEHERQEKR